MEMKKNLKFIIIYSLGKVKLDYVHLRQIKVNNMLQFSIQINIKLKIII